MEREIRLNQSYVGVIGARRLIDGLTVTTELSKVILDGEYRRVINFTTGTDVIEHKKSIRRDKHDLYVYTESMETPVFDKLLLTKNVVYRRRAIAKLAEYEIHVTNRISPSGSSISIEIEGSADPSLVSDIYTKMYGPYYTLIPSMKHQMDKLYLYLQTPIDLTWKDLTSSILTRGITLKADGIRVLYVRSNIGEFLYTSAKEVIPLSPTKGSLTIIDCEMISTDELYSFDILYADGVDVRNKDLKSRIAILNSIKTPSFVRRKEMYFPADINDFFKKVNELSKLKGDGVIFTHPGEYTQSPFKWKPESMLTIDFFIDENGRRALFYSNDFVYPTLPDTQNKGPMIAEFFDDNIIRVRDDKLAPNSYSTFKRIMKMKSDPILLEDLTGQSLRLMRKYHNRIKRRLYTYLEKMNVKTITDIGSGKFGDINSWNKFDHIYAIEPYESHYSEAHQRALDSGYTYSDDQYHGDTTITLFKGTASEYESTRTDALTFFNSLTFIDAETLRRLASKTNIIIAMFIDGDRLRALIDQGLMNNELIKIRYINSDRIHIDMKGSTVHDQEENIIDPSSIIDTLSDFIIDYDFYATEETLLGNSESLYSSCQRIMVFRRPLHINKRRRIEPLILGQSDDIITPYGLYTRRGVTTLSEFNDLADLYASLRNTLSAINTPYLIADKTWTLSNIDTDEEFNSSDRITPSEIIFNNDIYYEPLVRYRI